MKISKRKDMKHYKTRVVLKATTFTKKLSKEKSNKVKLVIGQIDNLNKELKKLLK